MTTFTVPTVDEIMLDISKWKTYLEKFSANIALAEKEHAFKISCATAINATLERYKCLTYKNEVILSNLHIYNDHVQLHMDSNDLHLFMKIIRSDGGNVMAILTNKCIIVQ